MSKRKSSSEIDTVIKMNFNLKKQLINQLELFVLSKNENLLIQLNELIKFKKKKIENNQTSSNIYSEMTIFQIKKIIDLLCKLECYHLIQNPAHNLRIEIDKLKDEIKYDLTMSGFEFNENIEDDIISDNELNCNNNSVNDKPINQSNYDETNFDETNYDNESIYDRNNYNINEQINVESNHNLNESTNEPINQPINELNNEPLNQTINKSLNNDKSINKFTNDNIIEHLFSLAFEYLSISDLFNCRLVNKQFKQLSNNTNGIYKLIIGRPYFEDFYWYYNNKLIEDKDMISLECFRSIKLLSIFNLDKNLKYLKIYDRKLKLEELSNFINLESIELGHYYNQENQLIINLNNLKILVSNYQSIKLNTPKLDQIQFQNIDKITFDSNPESIKHLITTNYNSKFEIFKNLEIIELRHSTKSINDNLLIMFKHLKKLKIDLEFDKINYLNKKMKNCLIKILNDKIKLRRDIDIYLEGVKIVNIDKFNELIEDEIWRFILNNYDLLDLNLSFMEYLNYEQLERCINNIKYDLPSNFFDRFKNICDIDVFRVNDVDGLNWFLNNLKYLIKLEINENAPLLDQNFYNNLPNTINYLTISNNENINYDFILKLTKLIDFETYNDEDLFDLALSSFSNLKYLKNFTFYFSDKEIEIKKIKDDFYLNQSKRKLNYKQLLKKCNTIKSKINS